MSVTPPTEPVPMISELDALAMDYVIGSQSLAERQAAEMRLVNDAAFRAAVAQWQAVLSPLDALTAPVTPPPGLWTAIEAEVRQPPRLAMAAKAATQPQGGHHGRALRRAVGIGGLALAAIVIAVLAMAAAPSPF